MRGILTKEGWAEMIEVEWVEASFYHTERIIRGPRLVQFKTFMGWYICFSKAIEQREPPFNLILFEGEYKFSLPDIYPYNDYDQIYWADRKILIEEPKEDKNED